jgi:hypothetical protein
MADQPVVRRKYTSRKEEFYSYTIEQLLQIVKDTSGELSAIITEQQTNKTVENELKRKDLNNRRIRVYTRLRKLGYSASAMRKKDAPVVAPPVVEAPKVEEVKTEAPVAPTS